MHSDRSDNRTRSHREFFAKLVTANAGIPPESELGVALTAALATLPRERFVAPPPWRVFTRAGVIETHSSDPAFLYQDVVVPLGVGGHLNNGQPTLHAFCIAALCPQKGEKILHIGAGTGYYTAILAMLIGESGAIDAYEIHPELARRAAENLAEFPQVTIHPRSGAEGNLPPCDVLYVNASSVEPLAIWLDALRPGGRLLFPLAPESGSGGMLLITRREDNRYSAQFLCQAQFVPCTGAQNEAENRALAAAFSNAGWSRVKSLYRDDSPDESCWYSGNGWWLSYA
ncbi:MAG: methyltransferase [Acetobacteraceae bacterium]|nr:methyltransferase [Acetobacteraceae bacterium]